MEDTNFTTPEPESLEFSQTADERRLKRAQLFGALSHLHEETERIMQIIEEDCEQIDPEDWE